MAIRVLVVNAWDGASGVFTVIRSLSERLGREGVRYSSFCFDGWSEGTRWAEICERLYSNREVSLTEVLARDRFDIVKLVDTACPSVYGPAVWMRRARWRGAVVCMSQNTIPEIPPGMSADAYVACSIASRAVMERTVGAPISVVPNGVDTDFFYPSVVPPPPRPILAWVGRTSDRAQKDFDGFLHIASRLLPEGYSVRVADGDGSSAEAARVARWFGGRVEYLAALDRTGMVAFYRGVAASGGCLVSTSNFEGLPLAALEAIACGCPVLAPSAPGFEELERDGIALIYQTPDGIEKAVSLVRQLNNKEAREGLVTKGLQAVRGQYALERMADGYMRVYREALEKARGRAPVFWDPLARELWVAAIRARRFRNQLTNQLRCATPKTVQLPG